MTAKKLKTPVTYYGGKQRLLKHILPLIPDHIQYVEPFFGGGAVYFAKQPSRGEVINDRKNEVINFYRVIKNDFKKLNKLIQSTLHSEYDFRRTRDILKSPVTCINRIEHAWSFWCQTRLTFSSNPLGGFSFTNNGKSPFTTANKKREFTRCFEKRLERTEIFCRDAIDLIKLKDGDDTFFYCDPPYVSADQGFYSGYTYKDFESLLDVLSKIKGKFLLSSYPEIELIKYRKKFGWNHLDISQTLSVQKVKNVKRRKKLECLTWNYSLENI